jgi:hypothetical protein
MKRKRWKRMVAAMAALLLISLAAGIHALLSRDEPLPDDSDLLATWLEVLDDDNGYFPFQEALARPRFQVPPFPGYRPPIDPRSINELRQLLA